MAKTNPIGVRFDKDMLLEFKEDKLAETPQGALNFLAEFYRENGKKTKKTTFKAGVILPQSEKVKLKDLTTPSKGTTNDLNEVNKKSNVTINTKGGGKKETDYLASRRKLKS
jgi:hypothetical protein